MTNLTILLTDLYGIYHVYKALGISTSKEEDQECHNISQYICRLWRYSCPGQMWVRWKVIIDLESHLALMSDHLMHQLVMMKCTQHHHQTYRIKICMAEPIRMQMTPTQMRSVTLICDNVSAIEGQWNRLM